MSGIAALKTDLTFLTLDYEPYYREGLLKTYVDSFTH